MRAEVQYERRFVLRHCGRPSILGYEVDFLPVGKESKSGDAIVLRYGDLTGPRGRQTVVVIDGGFSDDGEVVANHIKRRYGTGRVDIVISSHPDQDHVSGLETLITQVEVGQLWMHRPWMHSQALALAKSADFTGLSLTEATKRTLTEVSNLEKLATRIGIPILEPFAGAQTADGVLTVLGPSADYYNSLVAETQQRETVLETATRMLKEAAAAVVRRVRETLDHETLTDAGTVSPLNNSSVISMLNIEGRRILFTADAGMPALEYAMTYAERLGLTAGSYVLVQVPHHGSRRNVGPTILNRILGPRLPGQRVGSACVSAAVDGEPKHPSKQVTNAFFRRGYPVFATKGNILWWQVGAPARGDFSSADAVPFYDEVEVPEGE